MVEKRKVRSALNWSAFELFARHGLGFLISIILARMLAPSDFGVLAMLSIFIALANLFIDSGFSQALIQRQESTRIDESTIFFFNVLIGILVAVGLCAAAPWIAEFYRQPILRDVAYVMSLCVFVGAFGSIHTALLTKELNFRTQAKSGVFATVVSGVLAIYLAANDYGVWSLVWQSLASSVVMVLMLWYLHPWRPMRVFSLQSLRSHFRFGGFLLLTGILHSFYVNLSSLLIGRFYSTRDVGFYSRAQNLQQVPVSLMTSVVGRVSFPVFAKSGEDKAKLARGMRKAQAAVMLINVPVMMGVSVLSEPLIRVLLGEKWLESAPLLQVLSLGGILWPLNVLNLNVLKAQGRSDLNVWLALVKITFGLSAILIASSRSVLHMAYAQAVASVFAFFVNAYYTRVLLGYGALAQLRDLFPCFVAASLSGLGMWLVMESAKFSSAMTLPLAVGLGGVLYLAACYLLKVQVLSEMLGLFSRPVAAGSKAASSGSVNSVD